MIGDVDEARLRPGLRGRVRNLRACAICGRPCIGSRCSAHPLERGSTIDRGYDADHTRLRAELAPEVATGGVRCAAGADCDRAVDGVADFIRPGEPWHLGHKADRSGYLGPMHTICNSSTARRVA